MTREEFQVKASELATSLHEDFLERMMKAFDALTPDEVAKLADDRMPYYIVRAIAMVVVNGAVENCLNAGAIKNLTRKVRMILKTRWY